MSEDRVEALRTIVLAGDFDGCVEFFNDMPEKERRALAPVTTAFVRELDQHYNNSSSSKNWRQIEKALRVSVPATHATASLSELKPLENRSGHWLYGEALRASSAILQNRRPKWLTKWCDWLLERNSWYWILVRPLEREGLCDPERSEFYARGMTRALLGTDGTRLAGLREDPEMLDEVVWRLFEIDGFEADRSWKTTGSRTEEKSWAHALRELSKTGELGRDRMLDASLDALKLDFAEIQAGWYRFFHEYLEPSMEERAARADHYLDLAIGPHLPTASFAMKALVAVHKAGALDAGNFVARIEPALFAQTKAVVKPALDILASIAKSSPKRCAEIARIAAIGLEHKMPDLQDESLSLIEAHGDPDDPVLRDLVEERLTLIPSSLKQRVAVWLGRDLGEDDTEATTAPEQIDALFERARALPPDVAQRAGVDLALEELEDLRGFIPAIELPVPWLIPPEMSISTLMDAGSRWLHNLFHEPVRRYIDPCIFELLVEALREPKALMEKKGRLHGFLWSMKLYPIFTPSLWKLGPDDPICPLTIGELCQYFGGETDREFLIAAVDDGRIDGKKMGLVMRRMLFQSELRPHTSAPELAFAAEASPLHRQVVRWVLEYSLGNVMADKLPHNVHMFLELLHNLCIQTGETITDPDCRAFLEARSGNSKAAKLAKKLLALEPGDSLPHRHAAAALALAGRVERAERAERWAERQ